MSWTLHETGKGPEWNSKETLNPKETLKWNRKETLNQMKP